MAERLAKFVRCITKFRYIEVLFRTFYYYWGKENRLFWPRTSFQRDSLYRRSTVWLILMGLPKVQAISRPLIIFAIYGYSARNMRVVQYCAKDLLFGFSFFFSKKERKNDLICRSPRWRGEFSPMHDSIATPLFLIFFLFNFNIKWMIAGVQE